MIELPRRVDGIDMSAAGDGYVIYDAARDRVHYLNHSAALVLEFCTGENSVGDIVRIFQAAYELPDLPEEEIRECLRSLREEGLVK